MKLIYFNLRHLEIVVMLVGGTYFIEKRDQVLKFIKYSKVLSSSIIYVISKIIMISMIKMINDRINS